MLSALHPLPKLAVCLAWIVAAIAVFDPAFQLATIGLAVFLLVAVERRSPLLVFGLMVPFALFGFGFLTTAVLFRQPDADALRVAGTAAVAAPALTAGLTLFFRAIACGMVSAVFVLTTDPGDLVKASMAQLRLPPRIGFALLSALALVPDLGREVQQIRMARALRRGRAPGRLMSPVELFAILIPLLAYAIRRAGRSALAMEARGLAPAAPRTILDAPVIRRRDGVFALGGSGLLAAIVLGTIYASG